MFPSMFARKPDKEVALKQLRTHVAMFGAWVAVTKICSLLPLKDLRSVGGLVETIGLINLDNLAYLDLAWLPGSEGMLGLGDDH
ncbi:hypothetical protein CsSME_00009479 [Camellia sinensis var. sinensis]